jgi:asparagine N-glycosylation enzyme membrane subunit Stt3
VNTVVCSWWDYGYYITILGDRISLSDNSTINSTQIRKIALAFTSNESIAIKILSQYGVDYIAVFTTIREAKMRGYPFYWGDEAKWHWMASIAGLDREVLKDPELPRRLGLPWGIELPKGDILLTKLMIYGALDEEQFKPDNLTLVFRSSNKLVLIYSLNKTI